LRMLQHAQPGFHLPCLDLFVSWIFHPDPPTVRNENNPPVRDVYYQLQSSLDLLTGWS
jgi:hypothetical protein